MAYFQSVKGSEIMGTMQVFLQFYIVLLFFFLSNGFASERASHRTLVVLIHDVFNRSIGA